MMFNEIFSSYYRVTAAILREAARGALTERKLFAMVRELAFGESLLTMPDDLMGGKWHLLRRDLSTPLRKVPETPLTLLEKRWLKTLLADPRIQLFSPEVSGLEDAEPLFVPEDIVYYDRYADGDDYMSPEYIASFRTILEALREKENLVVDYETRNGRRPRIFLTPYYLEYSEKDDRFRLVGAGLTRQFTMNLAQIRGCILQRGRERLPFEESPKRSVTFELMDHRNALERVLLHFSHLEKETRKLEEGKYLVTLKYDKEDETELVIRILSFGPFIRVTEPDSFIDLIRERLVKQMALCHEWQDAQEDGVPGIDEMS